MADKNLSRCFGEGYRCLNGRELFEWEKARRETRYVLWKLGNEILARHGLEEMELDPRDDIKNFLYPASMGEAYAE